MLICRSKGQVSSYSRHRPRGSNRNGPNAPPPGWPSILAGQLHGSQRSRLLSSNLDDPSWCQSVPQCPGELMSGHPQRTSGRFQSFDPEVRRSAYLDLLLLWEQGQDSMRAIHEYQSDISSLVCLLQSCFVAHRSTLWTSLCPSQIPQKPHCRPPCASARNLQLHHRSPGSKLVARGCLLLKQNVLSGAAASGVVPKPGPPSVWEAMRRSCMSQRSHRKESNHRPS
mmetsp:Transcript_55327/g.112481  ORF Transcript_55327/g.112481 Transcript_55327/m.112481 type:complete len:226 (+) Transcript_55327:186-863(+)